MQVTVAYLGRRKKDKEVQKITVCYRNPAAQKMIAERGGRKLLPSSDSIVAIAVQGSFQRQKMGIGRK